jgi:hypothetical protein
MLENKTALILRGVTSQEKLKIETKVVKPRDFFELIK